MPIPAFNIDGVIPPFIGGLGPGAQSSLMTPYEVTPLEIVQTLGTSPGRRQILAGWIAHRAELRALNITIGFQWLDGSFVEKKEPQDLDIVTFFRRPPGMNVHLMGQLFRGNPRVFSRAVVRATHHLDAMPVDMDATLEAVVDSARYWLGLFSHRRSDFMWKGMLKVRLEENGDDAIASAALNAADLATVGAA